jgi:hypothetical protein
MNKNMLTYYLGCREDENSKVFFLRLNAETLGDAYAVAWAVFGDDYRKAVYYKNSDDDNIRMVE